MMIIKREIGSHQWRTRIPAFIGTILAVSILAGSLYRLLPPKIELVPQIVFPTNSTVITQIQNIGKLETVTYTLDKVISYDPDAGQWYHFLGDRKTLFVVQGEVIAGFDLAKLSKNDIQTQGKPNKNGSITLNMPTPQIIHSKIDEKKVEIYDLNTGAYSLWSPHLDPNTTVKILGNAENALRDDACKAGILQKATDSAKSQLTAFLVTTGFANVTINIPDGKCA